MDTITTRQSLLERIAFGVLLVITFLIPIFFVPVAFISSQFGTSLLFAFGVIIVALLYIVSSLMRGSVDLPQPAKRIMPYILVVPVVYLLAGIANGFSRMTFLGYTFDQSTVGFILLAFAYLFFVSVYFRDKSRIFYSYLAIVGSALITALFIFLRIIIGAKFLSFGIFTDITATPVGSWNSLAIFFGISALFALFACEMIRASKLMKSLSILALLISLFFIALINFNVVWIVLGAISLLFILYKVFGVQYLSAERISFGKKLKQLPPYAVFVLLVSIICIFWGGSLGGRLSAHVGVANVEVRPSLSVTLEIAKNTITNRPLFGSGPNTFVTQWLAYRPDAIIASDFWNTDFSYGIGLLPTFAVTTGLVGVISWILFLGLIVYLGSKSLFARVEDPLIKFLVVSSFFVSIFLWTMACLYIPSPAVFILAFFFSGTFLASIYLTGIVPVVTRVFSLNPKTGFVSSLGLVALLVASLALGYGLFRTSKSLWYFQKSSYAINTNNDIANGEALMKSAVGVVPEDIYYRSLAQIETAKLGQITSQDPKKVSQEDLQKQVSAALSDAIQAGLAARDADPSNYLNWIALGQVYESAVPLKVQGAYESAQFAYNEAFRRNPKNPGIFLLLSRLEADNNNLANARAYAQQAIQAKQNYLDAYYLLAQIELADKNVKGAVDSVTAASVLSPNDPNIFFQLGYLKFNTQDFAGAIKAFNQSLALSPQYANAKYYLGLSYEATGDHQNAIAQFTDLKKTNPDNQDVTAILTALEAGKPIFDAKAQAASAKPGKQSLPVKESQ